MLRLCSTVTELLYSQRNKSSPPEVFCEKDVLENFAGKQLCFHQRCSMKKGALRNFAKFTGKHLCQSLIFNKVAGLRPATLLKKRLWHRCFPVNFAKFLRTPFLQNTSGRLLLYFHVLAQFLYTTSDMEQHYY